MKKIILIFSIFFLLILTTFIKNETKEIENKIFLKKENIRELKAKYDLVLLDYNYLGSPKKLFKLQEELFDDEFINYRLDEIQKIIFFNDKVLFHTNNLK
ncbi:cell division protein FtsL [Candidatus Pelagibacter sp.]|nr:cell division protein FtsL [Candidatus Pelagibacter sp.]